MDHWMFLDINPRHTHYIPHQFIEHTHLSDIAIWIISSVKWLSYTSLSRLCSNCSHNTVIPQWPLCKGAMRPPSALRIGMHSCARAMRRCTRTHSVLFSRRIPHEKYVYSLRLSPLLFFVITSLACIAVIY